MREVAGWQRPGRWLLGREVRQEASSGAPSPLVGPSSGPTSAEALDLLPTGIVLVDANGLMVRRNAAADALVDSWEDGVLGRRVLERLVEAVRPGSRPITEQVRTPGAFARVFEVRVRAVFAPSLDGDASSTEDRVPTGAVAMFDDVTERVRIESVRRDFVANVSHELKTPVGAISLLTEALAGEKDPQVVERLTGRIGTEARRMSGLVEDLLDLRAAEEGDVGELAVIDLVGVVTEVVERVEPLAQRRGVYFDVDLPVAAQVNGVRTQLFSLVRNLVENGVKYSDKEGTVHLRLSSPRNTTGIADETDDKVVFQVIDHGMGIPERDLDRVFERFYRVDRARARDTGGSGLGLSIVRNVVKEHGGVVELDSREGVGTTVTVRLPTGPTR